MKLDVLFVSILIAFGSLILTFFFVALFKKHKTPEIRILSFLLGATALYILGYALELLAVSTDWKLIFNHVQYFGLPFIAPAWLLMSLQFCKRIKKAAWKPVLLIFIIPAATLVFNLTHTVNGLLYSSYGMEQYGSFSVLVFTKGVWYYAEAINKTLLLLTSLFIYVRALARAGGVRKKQAVYLLILSVFGVIFALSSLFGARTTYIDPVCILLSGSFILLAVTLLRYELFDLVPLAYSKLFDVLSQPIFILTGSKTIVKANTEAKRVFEQALDSKDDIRLNDLFDEDEADPGYTKDNERLYRMTRNGGTRYYSVKLIDLESPPEAAERGKGYLAVLTDTTSHVEQVQSLETLAAGDPLTGLYNRRHFFSVSKGLFNEAGKREESASLVIFDIDHFKTINDIYGHQAGDYVLCAVSDVISRQLRCDDLLGRLGGDEFVLFLGTADTAAAETVARRICTAVREKEYVFEGKSIGLTISAGVGGGKAAVFDNMDELMSMADNALYNAKSTGRNKVCISTKRAAQDPAD